jgi:glycosyltransferase involved in cell wall biosynthesis
MLFGGSRDRFIMRGSDALIATSEKLKKAMIAASGVAQDKILVAYGGIDLELYTEMSKSEARITTHLPQDKKIVAYVGFFKTMGMEKGIRTMIESLTTLPEEVVMLFVGGKDDEISEYRTYADTLGVTIRCIFVGRKSQSELAAYEAAADVLAIPYPDKPHYRDFGFPMKVYEYMASNRPIIYSKLDLVEEVLTPYAKGFTADDATDFAKAVLDVLGNYAAWSTKATEAAQNVTNYSWKRKAEKILNFLQL